MELKIWYKQPSQLLRGKVAGVQVTQSSGRARCLFP
jgi:hypothetical protein